MYMKEKNVTNEDLAIMVKKGFDVVDERFDKVDKRFDTVDDKFSEVNHRLDNIEHLIAEEHRIRIERLEENVNTLMNAVGLSK